MIGLSFIIGLAFSWERWGNPLVDCGREMNQPLRLAQGQMLYSDVRHIYGPLSPYVNAWLYEIFGASLWVLYADGIFTAILIIGLVYLLSRKLMEPVASGAAALSVMWLCAFKPAGNYILPYTYSALHGCALGLASLALLVLFVERCDKSRTQHGGELSEASETEAGMGFSVQLAKTKSVAIPVVFAGVAAGLATLAKTEMGLAAVCAGIIAVALTGYPNMRRVFGLGALFVMPAAALVCGVYGYITARVGWHTIAEESFLFLRNLPPELVFFNKRVSGFDQPLLSIGQIIGSALRTSALAMIIATVSLLITKRRNPIEPAPARAAEFSVSDAGHASYPQIWAMLAGSILLFVLMPLFGALNWERGPYVAMPILLVVLIGAEINRYRRQKAEGSPTSQTIVFVVIGVYALASLARVILRVRSGGAYSSYLVPASVILFTYAWAHSLARLFRDRDAGHLASKIGVAIILADVVLTAGLLSFRYRDRNTFFLNTDRGTMVAVPDLGQAMNEAISFVKRETAEGESIAIMPEGTSLNFFTGRPNPLREEITTPGYLDRKGEERAIQQLIKSNTRFVFVANRATWEFGPQEFGRDYCTTLMKWINQNFDQVAMFGPDHNPSLSIGDKTFFIRAYRKRAAA